MIMSLITLVRGLAVLTALNIVSAGEYKIMKGHTLFEDYRSPLPYTYIKEDELPDAFTWGNVNGTSYLSKSHNQHIPHYCGSCWAFGSLTALADRIKIARGGLGDPINLSVQYILNCGTSVAGSCHGGSDTGVYEFIKKHSGFVPYDTCMPYLACSDDSEEGFCKHIDTKCSKVNTCRTCSSFASNGGTCSEVDTFPNATIAEYGTYSKDVHKIKAEIYARGPVAAGVDAIPLLDYQGGIVRDTRLIHKMVGHIVSIVGWGKDEESGKQYWIVRNSWGQYWGEMGFFRIEMGNNELGIESQISWATLDTFTVNNFPCNEDGANCGQDSFHYVDPSENILSVKRRLRGV